MILKFVIPGEPQGKERPRFARGKKVRTYTPKVTHNYEGLVRLYAVEARRRHHIVKPIAQNCGVSIKAYFSVPRSYSKKRKEACLSGKESPTKKPDSDNIAKIVLDGMNPRMKLNRITHHRECVQEGFYEDDKQVTRLVTEKKYAEKPCVEVTVTWTEDKPNELD